MTQLLATDPHDLLLDDTNDLVIRDGDFVFARGVTGVAQECRVAVQMFAEEWFLDLDAGIPYLQDILARRATVVTLVAKREYRDQLLKVEGVLEIVSLDTTFDQQTRTLTITWVVRTALGDTPPDTLKINQVT